MENVESSIQRATEFLKSQLSELPQTVVILGSGFAGWVKKLDVEKVIPYSSIPGFPITTIKGHDGNLIVARLASKLVLVMQGRFHFYEGHSLDVISIPLRVFAGLGVRSLIITNAAGSINHSFRPGDLMLITDHINHSLRYPTFLNGMQSPGLTPYSLRMQGEARRIAEEEELKIHDGTYIFTTGPSYETPAEIKAMRILGADAVGMSTVPEILSAAHCGMEIVAVSMISNYGSGIKDGTLDHQEVMDTMKSIQDRVDRFLMKLTTSTLS